MIVTPDFSTFEARYQRGEAQCLTLSMVADLETPVSAYLKLAALRGESPSFLLESVEDGAVRGRYSIIGMMPDRIFRVVGDKVEVEVWDNNLHSGTKTTKREETFSSLSPLEALRLLIKQGNIPHQEGLPPMASGLFGLMGYDMVRVMERLPPAKPDQINVPDALLMRPQIILVFDAVKDEIQVITPVFADVFNKKSARVIYEAACERLENVITALETSLPHSPRKEAVAARMPMMNSNTTPQEYAAMVARAKEYILSGDIFQVVLSQRFACPFDLDAFSLYRALRRTNPSPYLCYLDWGDFQIVCSSPEILVKLEGGKVTLRPIAGTRRRGATLAEDQALAEELLADPKERAEHLMLLDLGRNDLGRVAKTGSVKVTDSFFIERYSQVMHIVSQVEAELAPGYDAVDALVAGFPAGTVSGAPKIRAMEIIDELEKDKRGAYAGSIGYFGSDGAMDSCIVLRTALIKDGKMYVQAGAGIVHDSVAASEQAECENKAKALFRAAEEAVRFASLGTKGQ